jgi:hypothetical protein
MAIARSINKALAKSKKKPVAKKATAKRVRKPKVYDHLFFDVHENPNCCGIAEIGSFGLARPYDYNRTYMDIEKQTAAELRERTKQALKDHGVTIAQGTTLVGDKDINELLRASGWKIVGRFKSLSTGNRIIQWRFTRSK